MTGTLPAMNPVPADTDGEGTQAREHSAAYRHHLLTEEWRATCALVYARCAGICERCGEAFAEAVHHLTYERLGAERLEDLQALCSPCHRAADKERANASAAARAERRWNARIDGWACKRWGEDWELNYSWDEAEERFEAWLERKGYDCYGDW